MTTEFPCNNYSTYNEFEDLFKDIRAQNNYKLPSNLRHYYVLRT